MTATQSLEIEQKELIYRPEDLEKLDLTRLPKHIAIIMDGNRRWAKKRNLPPLMGHWEGVEVLTDVVRAAAELGIETLTVYSFSTENWSRDKIEIETLMNIAEVFLIKKRELMVSEGIRLDAIGDLTRLPPAVQKAFLETRKATEGGDGINLILAMNYGGRDEIRRAVGRILARNDQRKISPEELTEQFIAQFLDTARWGDPDLLIRTSGEYRISNFLLWQISYSEMFVTDVLWPDFNARELLRAVHSYQERHRRLGG